MYQRAAISRNPECGSDRQRSAEPETGQHRWVRARRNPDSPIHPRNVESASFFWRSRLHQFDAITEWIVGIDPVMALERIVVPHDVAHSPQRCNKMRQVFDEQRRVSFSGRVKVGFDAQMNLQFAALEPASAALSQLMRLRNFGNAENSLVKLAGSGLAAQRHGKLNVLESSHQHGIELFHFGQGK